MGAVDKRKKIKKKSIHSPDINTEDIFKKKINPGGRPAKTERFSQLKSLSQFSEVIIIYINKLYSKKKIRDLKKDGEPNKIKYIVLEDLE